MKWLQTGAIRVEGLPAGVATLSITAIDANHEQIKATEDFEITEGATIRRNYERQM